MLFVVRGGDFVICNFDGDFVVPRKKIPGVRPVGEGDGNSWNRWMHNAFINFRWSNINVYVVIYTFLSFLLLFQLIIKKL